MRKRMRKRKGTQTSWAMLKVMMKWQGDLETFGLICDDKQWWENGEYYGDHPFEKREMWSGGHRRAIVTLRLQKSLQDKDEILKKTNFVSLVNKRFRWLKISWSSDCRSICGFKLWSESHLLEVPRWLQNVNLSKWITLIRWVSLCSWFVFALLIASCRHHARHKPKPDETMVRWMAMIEVTSMKWLSMA